MAAYQNKKIVVSDSRLIHRKPKAKKGVSQKFKYFHYGIQGNLLWEYQFDREIRGMGVAGSALVFLTLKYYKTETGDFHKGISAAEKSGKNFCVLSGNAIPEAKIVFLSKDGKLLNEYVFYDTFFYTFYDPFFCNTSTTTGYSCFASRRLGELYLFKNDIFVACINVRKNKDTAKNPLLLNSPKDEHNTGNLYKNQIITSICSSLAHKNALSMKERSFEELTDLRSMGLCDNGTIFALTYDKLYVCKTESVETVKAIDQNRIKKNDLITNKSNSQNAIDLSILGLTPTKTYSKEEIVAAYRKKIFQVHPDRNPSSDAHEMTTEINLSYSNLINQKDSREQAIVVALFSADELADGYNTISRVGTDILVGSYGGHLECYSKDGTLNWRTTLSLKQDPQNRWPGRIETICGQSLENYLIMAEGDLFFMKNSQIIRKIPYSFNRHSYSSKQLNEIKPKISKNIDTCLTIISNKQILEKTDMSGSYDGNANSGMARVLDVISIPIGKKQYFGVRERGDNFVDIFSEKGEEIQRLFFDVPAPSKINSILNNSITYLQLFINQNIPTGDYYILRLSIE